MNDNWIFRVNNAMVKKYNSLSKVDNTFGKVDNMTSKVLITECLRYFKNTLLLQLFKRKVCRWQAFWSKQGPVAEWLGRALQKLPQRFESARDLLKGITAIVISFLILPQFTSTRLIFSFLKAVHPICRPAFI